MSEEADYHVDGTISANETTPTPPVKKRKSIPRSERDKECTATPVRPNPTVYTRDEKGNVVDTKMVIKGVKSKDFQPSKNKRTASRTGFYDTIARDILKLRNVCNDHVTVGIKKWATDISKGEDGVKYFSTERDFSFHAPDQAPSSVPPTTPPAVSLALSSPSTSRHSGGVPTARAMSKQKNMFCRMCDVKYKQKDNDENPWVGCRHKNKQGVRCENWVHARCTGWFPQNAYEVASMPGWYCPKHLKSKLPVNTATNIRKSAKKGGKKGPTKTKTR